MTRWLLPASDLTKTSEVPPDLNPDFHAHAMTLSVKYMKLWFMEALGMCFVNTWGEFWDPCVEAAKLIQQTNPPPMNNSKT